MTKQCWYCDGETSEQANYCRNCAYPVKSEIVYDEVFWDLIEAKLVTENAPELLLEEANNQISERPYNTLQKHLRNDGKTSLTLVYYMMIADRN